MSKKPYVESHGLLGEERAKKLFSKSRFKYNRYFFFKLILQNSVIQRVVQ